MADSVQIRNVPDDVREALAARAYARGESLDNYLLTLLVEDAGRTTAAPVARTAPTPISPIEITKAVLDSKA
ncbi:hypothetical protein ASE12_04390 [Aeromicrobium sp. Root236]|uniref:FitA-like ribbon-helix-helix domain-containing protein n=1 Tax=Aeromicrobium sp. Root236 TaxID=1736498 RepID=UPI0006F7AEAC|nr:hypothetical protein [Aeromicrobium sp. Root236]KRC64066.1 hypothetical protein ASE12_04390 [Aeromicrobium sp. Root236]